MNRSVSRQALVDGSCTVPGELLGLGPLLETDVPESESGQSVIPEFDGVVPGFLQQSHVSCGTVVHASDLRQGLTQIANRQWFLQQGGGIVFRGLAAPQHVKHQQ